MSTFIAMPLTDWVPNEFHEKFVWNSSEKSPEAPNNEFESETVLVKIDGEPGYALGVFWYNNGDEDQRNGWFFSDEEYPLIDNPTSEDLKSLKWTYFSHLDKE